MIAGFLIGGLLVWVFGDVPENPPTVVLSDNPVTDYWKQCREVDGVFEMVDATCGGEDCYMIKCDVPENNLFRHFVEEE